MVENFAALEYKTQEEVLTVIRHTTSVLSVAGVHMIDTVQRSIVQHDPSVSHSYKYWFLNYSRVTSRLHHNRIQMQVGRHVRSMNYVRSDVL